jgi:protein SCO1
MTPRRSASNASSFWPSFAGTTGCLRLAALVAMLAMPPARSQAQVQTSVLSKVGSQQRLDAMVPLDATFRDERGAPICLGDSFDGRPVVLVLAYYRCPQLCNEVLNGLVDSLRETGLELGRDFRVVTVSFDPREGPELAARKKAGYLKRYGHAATDPNWRFLTGDEGAIHELAEAAGFRYVRDPESEQFAHGSQIVVLTPRGRISRYFFGIQYPPRDLRLALVEASAGKIGTPVDQLLLLCYHFDPATGRYSARAMAWVRAAGVLTLVVLGSFIGRGWYRDWSSGRRRAAATR